MLGTWVGIGFLVAIIHVWADVTTTEKVAQKMNRDEFLKYIVTKTGIALLWPIGLYLLFFNSSKDEKKGKRRK